MDVVVLIFVLNRSTAGDGGDGMMGIRSLVAATQREIGDHYVKHLISSHISHSSHPSHSHHIPISSFMLTPRT